MTFKRPKDLTISDMCIWVDANAYTSTRDDHTFMTYLYHIVRSKAEKFGFFNKYEQYDDFSIYCVYKFLVRYDNNQETVVKSVSNYLKRVLEPWRAEYVREMCVGDPDIDIADFNVIDFSDYLVDVSSECDLYSYSSYCMKVSDIVWKHLSKIPRRKNSAEWCNICISCLLTLNDRLKAAASFSGKQSFENDPKLLLRLIRALKTKPPILFHIDKSLSNYVLTLVNEVVHALSAELSYTTGVRVNSSTCLSNLVKAASNNEEED